MYYQSLIFHVKSWFKICFNFRPGVQSIGMQVWNQEFLEVHIHPHISELSVPYLTLKSFQKIGVAQEAHPWIQKRNAQCGNQIFADCWSWKKSSYDTRFEVIVLWLYCLFFIFDDVTADTILRDCFSASWASNN